MKLSIKEQKRLISKYGEWAVVTGASSGIGLEICRQLAGAGFSLVINSRSSVNLQEVYQELKSKYDIQIKVIASDLSEENGLEPILNFTKDLKVGLLVMSAGYGTSGPFVESSLPREINMLRVNSEALLAITHHFSRKFKEQKRGGIILMSSMVAFQGVPFSAHYAATKAYVQTLAEALAIEVKPYGVDVLSAAPGPVESGFSKRANMKMSMSLTPEQVGVPILKALGRKTTVLPGLLTKFLVYSLQTVPRWGKVKIMQQVMGGMTAHQREGVNN
jgi:short-subunit dehydrogenase